MEAPRTVAMNTGSGLWISSEEMSINIETRPNAQMPTGKARSALNAAGEDWTVFVDGIFMSKTIPDGLTTDYRSLDFITFVMSSVQKWNVLPENQIWADANILRILQIGEIYDTKWGWRKFEAFRNPGSLATSISYQHPSLLLLSSWFFWPESRKRGFKDGGSQESIPPWYRILDTIISVKIRCCWNRCYGKKY